MAETAVYVYGVVKSAKRPSVRRAPAGLPGATAPAVAAVGRSLWAIVADVALDRYGPGPLEAALRDVERIGAIALAHESVVEHFARLAGATMVPAKLFTMFSSIDRAREDIHARRAQIAAAAKRIAGCDEWGVRILRTPAESSRPAGPVASTGTGFLAAKKRARDAKVESARAAAGAAAEAYDGLARLARAARQRNDVPDGAAAPPLLDAAFLVPRVKRARFTSAARRASRACATAGAAMTLSGPWPAYNFVQPPEVR